MGVEPLAESCKLAFEVARQGVEANPPIEPPASMRSFLYVAQLPRRAITVAHRVLDTDTEFRQRVAAQATEAKVGRAGFLWLHRPEGWESNFSTLIGESAAWTAPPPPAPVAERPVAVSTATPDSSNAEADEPTDTEPPPPPPPPSPAATGTSQPTSPPPRAPVLESSDASDSTDGVDSDGPGSGSGASTEHMVAPVPRPGTQDSAGLRPEKPKAPDLDTGRSEIENELASLRGLVDKLADERQNVGASVESLETAVVERRAEFSTVTTNPDTDSSDLQRARNERDAALTEKEAVTERLVASEREVADVRAELSAARVQLTRFETEKGDIVADLAAAKETAAALEAEVAQFDDERTLLRQQMESVVGERDDAWSAMADLRTERDELADRVGVAEQSRVDLEAELGQVSANWQDLQIELQSLTNQRKAVEAELAELQRARQVSDGELKLIFNDVASTLGRVEAERDLLAGKLDEAKARLQGTRSALDSATTSLQDELEGVDDAFGATHQAAAGLDEAVRKASQRLSAFEAGGGALEANQAPAQTPIPETASGEPENASATAFVDVDPFAKDSVDHLDESGEEIDADSADEQTLDYVMESHGLGAGEAADPSDNDQTADDASGRTKISVIEGDPVAVARHAVSTPDVVILLDGDPIAEMGWPTLSVAERREALIGYLGNLAAETGAASDVVFEGRVGSETELPVSRAVRVRLTHSNVEAADAVAEVIGEYPLAWPMVVVSDNPRLTSVAQSAGASMLDNGQLLDLFLASS